AIEPGDEVVVAETPLGPVGLSVCYDLRFPELYRALAARGARVVAVPSAFTAETGKDHWHVLLRARAIQNQVYVLAPPQAGSPGRAPPQRGARVGRRSLGDHPRRVRRAGGVRPRPPRLRLSGQGPGRPPRPQPPQALSAVSCRYAAGRRATAAPRRR